MKKDYLKLEMVIVLMTEQDVLSSNGSGEVDPWYDDPYVGLFVE